MKTVIICTAIAFIVIILATVDNDAMSDGTSTLGFPQTFYSYTGGKTTSGTYDRYGFIPMAFFVDLSFAALTGVVISFFIKRYKRNGR